MCSLVAVECIHEKPLEPFAASIEQDVLRFDVRVDDVAALVQEVQPCQHLAKEAALSHQPREGPQCLPCPSSCQSGQAQRDCKSGTFWALMGTISNKWFPVGVACGSRHKGFHHPTQQQSPRSNWRPGQPSEERAVWGDTQQKAA